MVSQANLELACKVQKGWAAAVKTHGAAPGPYSIREDGLVLYLAENTKGVTIRMVPAKKRAESTSKGPK